MRQYTRESAPSLPLTNSVRLSSGLTPGHQGTGGDAAADGRAAEGGTHLRADSGLPDRIMVRAGLLGGKPVIRDTRISAEHIVGMLAAGEAAESVFHEYPVFEPEDVRACLLLALRSLAGERVHEPSDRPVTCMRFLLDASTASLSMHAMLAGAGHDVKSASEPGPRASDEALLALACEEGRVLGTGEKDLEELALMRGLPHPCIVRLGAMRVGEKVSAMRELIERRPEALTEGNLVAVTRSWIRIRSRGHGVADVA